MKLYQLLKEYTDGDAYPMHMPGHKRNRAFLPAIDPLAVDITEIYGFDNLHAAEGVLKDAMDRAAQLWGAKKSHFLVNGSSSGILAAISAALPVDGAIAMDRSAHKSAYHAVELRTLTPHYLSRPIVEEYGIKGSLSPDEVARVLTAHPEIGALLITSPTYEGVVSDIAGIAKVVHDHGALLIVDEAHGAHLGFSDAFPKSAVTEGADLVIQSLHKTLPTFTQCAILHICSDWVDEGKIAKFLSYYQTTSPSYLFMAVMDACVELLNDRGEELFDAYERRLAEFRAQVAGLAHMGLLSGDSPMIWGFDPGKLYFNLQNTDLNGEELGRLLREEYQIECEMTAAKGCLCMTSIADTDEGFDRLARAILAIDAELSDADDRSAVAMPPIPRMVCTPAVAAERSVCEIALANADGSVAGEFVWAYPPDIPILVPGERIDRAMIDAMTALQESGVRLHSDSEKLPLSVRVLKNF